MKYYSAVVSEDEIRATCTLPPYCILASYYYFKNKVKLVQDCIYKQYDVFIDSGAFSAENSGKVIDIDDYCKYILETEAVLYAGLDVIGNAKKTRENTEYMIKQYGLKPIPTFHMGSDLSDLEALMGYPYIALGGMVFGTNLQGRCDAVWAYILKNNPQIRVHGFGLTNIELMERYPWYSVDSSSFKSCKRYGRQNILWNGFNFKTFSEEEYKTMLLQQGYTDLEDNKQKWFLYDFLSCQSYKLYGSHLLAVNKIKDFSYLTAQQQLF